MSKDDGGSAFPVYDRKETCPRCNYEVGVYPDEGMTLRDYFAAQALRQMNPAGRHYGPNYSPEKVARDCYMYADAMLAERNRDQDGEDNAS